MCNFRSKRGMWLGRLLPELEEKLELSRIGGVGFGRTGTTGVNLPSPSINTEVVPKPEDKSPRNKKKKKKPNGPTRTGGI